MMSAYWMRVTLLALTLGLASCGRAEAPSEDPLMRILSAIERGSWQTVTDLFNDDYPLKRFPLKGATDSGGVVEGVKRVRLMDRHLIFDVDVRSAGSSGGEGGRARSAQGLKRYSFWIEVTTPEYIPGEPTPAMTLGGVKGWSEGQAVGAPLVELNDINTPSRFSATSFRGVPDLQTLAVFDADNLDLKGWSATMIKLEPTLKSLKRRGCRKVNVRVSRAVLDKEVKACFPLLAREAQRAHLMGAITIKGDVALHDEERGSFAGSLTLQLPLDFEPRMRPEPQLTEAMIIGKEFTECIQQKVSQWGKDYIPRAACELTLPMLFKVSMPLKTPIKSLDSEGTREPQEP